MFVKSGNTANNLSLKYDGGVLKGYVDGTQKQFDVSLGHSYVHNKTTSNNLILDYTGGLIKGYIGTSQVYFDLGHNYIHNKTNSNNLLLDLSGDLIKGYSGSTQKYFDLGNTYIRNKNSANNISFDFSGGVIKAYNGSTQTYFDLGNTYVKNDTTTKKLSFAYDADGNTIKAYVNGEEVSFGNSGGSIFDLDYANSQYLGYRFTYYSGLTFKPPKDGIITVERYMNTSSSNRTYFKVNGHDVTGIFYTIVGTSGGGSEDAADADNTVYRIVFPVKKNDVVTANGGYDMYYIPCKT